MIIKLISAGLKGGPLPKADCYLDCRGIENPMRHGYANGVMLGAQSIVITENYSQLNAFQRIIKDHIHQLPNRRGKDWDQKPFVICCMCAHGIHRSVAVKHILASELVAEGYQVELP